MKKAVFTLWAFAFLVAVTSCRKSDDGAYDPPSDSTAKIEAAESMS